ncbi:hypothetical protein [Emticicia sp. 17c]|uniref:hypothetical protein n=1 Tax=Emticicia sp. 17c TaxID=3127704 RepID=UPI00301E35FE
MKKIILLLSVIISLPVKAQFLEATSDSFKTKVPIRFINIGEGAGKVLTSDASGVATWQSIASLWSVSGSGGNEIRNTNAGGFWSSNTNIVPITADNTSNPPTAPATGAGTRLMWIPSRSAFRCGTINADAWDASNIGLHSFATGYNSRATGTGNVAIGVNAISDGTSNTIAIGEGTQASGTNSTAIGAGVRANAYYSIAMGYYNSPVLTANATSWVSTDPLLYIGNGQDASHLSNAMVIQKNGVVSIGVIPNNSTTYRLRVGGSISASETIFANSFRASELSGDGVRQVCTDANGKLIACAASSVAYYNVSALGFHPYLSASTPSSAFFRNVDKALISFANNTKSENAYAFAPVELPDGVTVRKITMNYLQNTGGLMKLNFCRAEKLTDAASTIVTTINSIPAGGMQETSVDLDKDFVIDNSKYYYYLKLEAGSNWQGTDMALRGVIFLYGK